MSFDGVKRKFQRPVFELNRGLSEGDPVGGSESALIDKDLGLGSNCGSAAVFPNGWDIEAEFF